MLSCAECFLCERNLMLGGRQQVLGGWEGLLGGRL